MTYALSTWLAFDLCPPEESGWLTEQKATVIAGLIAAFGAATAFLGVWWQTGATRREGRRAENVAMLVESATAIQELTRAVDRVATTQDVKERFARVAEMNA